MCGSRRFWPFKVLFFAVVAVAFALLLGAVVMLLWNAILPEALGARPLSYWQAVGLLALCRILFGSFRFGPPWGRRGRPGKYWREKWKNMNEEERAQLKEKWKKRHGWGKKGSLED